VQTTWVENRRSLEPTHIHIRAAGKEAKFWLSPEVSLARDDGFDARTIRVSLEISEKHRKPLEDA
jgi:uncharacterized protein DUF4160